MKNHEKSAFYKHIARRLKIMTNHEKS